MFMTETEGGSDVGAITTRAVPDGDAFRLHGEKWFCSNPDAGLAMVLAGLAAEGITTVQGLAATVDASGESVPPAFRKMTMQWQQLAFDAPAHTLRLTGLAAGAGPVQRDRVVESGA